ncbi:hypothetical protein EJ110_NYTH19329 [Nymphaea thermarum]|nr:hypothetical protein EJ110_NYTH19329 [Nymphaea thermarum]
MVEWTPKSLITAFIGGLKEDIQIDIRAERNEILRKCFAKARAIEDRQRKKQALYKPWKNVQAVRPREAHQQKLLLAPPRKEEPKPVYRARVPPPMTREERELMIKNKKCFWCKEDWNSTHQCKHIRVYTVLKQVTDDEEKEPPLIIEEVYESEVKEEPKKEEEAPPEGECHMMADPNRPESMKVLGRIGDRQVFVLLDSGATHNFIGDHITQLSCTMEEQPTLRVLVANGDILSCTHKCTDVELTLQKVPFKVDLLVVPIPSVDVILGVKWLKSFGRVWWDFSTMEMCLPKEGGGGEVIKLQFPTGAWGQAPSQEGGSDTSQPSNWPRAATDVAESSHRGRGKAALHSVQTQQGQDDPSPGQEGGVGGVEQQGQAENEFTDKLGVEAEGGAGGNAMTLSEALEDQGGGSNLVLVKSSLVRVSLILTDPSLSPCAPSSPRLLSSSSSSSTFGEKAAIADSPSFTKTRGLSSLFALFSSSPRIHSPKDRWLGSLLLLQREVAPSFHDFPISNPATKVQPSSTTSEG